jgi:hypothetical protein
MTKIQNSNRLQIKHSSDMSDWSLNAKHKGWLTTGSLQINPVWLIENWNLRFI